MTADLSLAGTACNAYGDDISDLTLTVEYQTGMRACKETEAFLHKRADRPISR